MLKAGGRFSFCAKGGSLVFKVCSLIGDGNLILEQTHLDVRGNLDCMKAVNDKLARNTYRNSWAIIELSGNWVVLSKIILLWLSALSEQSHRDFVLDGCTGRSCCLRSRSSSIV